MKKLLLAGSIALLLTAAVVTVAAARGGNGKGNGKKSLTAQLEGFQEAPSIWTETRGQIKLKINGSSIRYELKYSDFEPPGETVLFAHIHLGQEGVNGGVAAFLCGGGGKPACPQGPATVTGTIAAADVRDLRETQGLVAGDIAGLIRAIKAGYTYANVHTAEFDTGEIRGQIGDDDDGHHNGGRGKHDKDHNEDDD
jgi:hypothetical protein